MDDNSNDFLHKMKHIDLCGKNLMLALDAMQNALTELYKSYIEPTVELPDANKRISREIT